LVDLIPVSDRNMSLDFKLRRGLRGVSWPEQFWNPIWLSPADPQTIQELFEVPLSAEELYEEALSLWATSRGDLIDKTLEFYSNFYLPDDILTKVDRASMLVSLESRAVFLDNDLVEFCRRLPNRFKIRNGERKWLLRRAMRGWLPSQTINRRKKGFGIPLAKWLRSWPRPDRASLANGMFKPTAIEEKWRRHLEGKSDERLLLFTWLALKFHLAARSEGAAAVRGAYGPSMPQQCAALTAGP
jgi:asparagine synthase (glutamine-hydrolysing)